MAIRVNISREERNPIDPKLFGSFIEHIENCILGGVFDGENPLSDKKGIRLDVLEKCRELAPPILRFPGGTVIGIYHWEDHVGPVSERKKMRNLIWGNRLCHEFGTAEFVTYCRAIGAEPMICVNMPTGSAEEAAHWVEYCNGTEDTYYANLRRSHGYEEPFHVKYWCIGNESAAEPDLGWQHDVKIYIREAWEFVKYMKLTDPTIRLVFVGANMEWNRAVLDNLYTVCDYFSLHCYSSNDYARIERYEEKTLKPVEALLAEYNARKFEFPMWYRFPPRAGDIRIALDEWNIWSSRATDSGKYGLMKRYNWQDALWVARFLHLMIRHSDTIGIANMAQMVNVIAPIVATREGSFKQTIFYPMRDYRWNCGAVLTDVQYDGEGIDLCATLTEDKRCVVFAVNTLAEARELELDSPVREMSTAYCDALDRVNTMEHDYVKEEKQRPNTPTVTLPPYSISVLRL